MELTAVAAQQSMTQLKLATSMIKVAHEQQQNVVDMIAATVSGSRGQNLNITV